MAVLAYDTAAATPKRWQWEESSKNSQSNNCGVTCATFIAGFFNDTSGYGIETTRRLIGGMGPYNVNGEIYWGAPEGTPTNPWQQRDMLIRRGVPAEAKAITTLSQLRQLVGSGQQPVIVGLKMSEVPDYIKDHVFDGWHAIVVLDWGYHEGVRGFWITDPNFHPPSDTYRVDPDRGRKFYPDSVMQRAMIDAASTPWCVAPIDAKSVPDTRGRGRLKGAGCTIRTDKNLRAESVWARARRDGYTHRQRDGRRLWANTQQFYFLRFDATRKWAAIALANGRRLWVHRDDFVVVRWP